MHPPAATAGAKRNDGPERVIQGLPLASDHVIDHLLAVLAVAIFGQPDTNVVRRRLAQ